MQIAVLASMYANAAARPRVRFTGSDTLPFKRRHPLLIPGLLLGLASGALPAYAQSTASPSPEAQAQAPNAASGATSIQENTLPQVTVTAERRETKLQETPVSVGVIGGAALRQNDNPLNRDLTAAVAGITAPGAFQGTGGGGPIYIRGIGTSSPTYSSAVPLYVDDVYIARQLGSGLYLGMPDVDRVEILRGPQGTLYGENSSAGAVKIITKDPTDNVAWIQATGATNNGYGTKGYISRVLVPDVLYGSIAFNQYHDQGSTYDETLHKYVDGANYQQFRAKIRLTPTRDFEAVFSIDGTHDGGNTNAPIALNYPGTSPNTTAENTDAGIDRNVGGMSLRLTKIINDHLTFKSISAYRQIRDDRVPTLLDGLPTDTFGFLINMHQHQVTQELQLLGDYGRFKFTTGVIGLREGFDINRPSWTAGSYKGIQSDVNNTSVAAYAQGTYQITERLGATAGIRLNRDWQIFNEYGYASTSALGQNAKTFSTGDLTQDVNSVTPKIGIDYKWTPNLFSYASITKGEKSGGYNPVAATLQIADVAVNPEKVLTYEVGTKANLLGGRLQANASLFYNDFKDYQAAIANAIVNGQAVNGSVTVNAGKARTYGTELELIARPIRNLTLSGSLTLLQGTFQEFLNPTGAPAANYVGNLLPYVSHVVAATSAVYTLPPIGLPGVVRVNGTVRYLTPSYQDIGNTLRSPSQIYVDLGSNFVASGGHWSAQLQVRNVLNRRYVQANFYTPSIGLDSAFYNPGRTAQVSVRYDF
ncbi:MAG: TonB-dependent receptor [Janthinobacterium lividum]